MAVGFILLVSLAKPDYLADAQIVLQMLLDLRLAQVGIAVGIKQAFLGRDQGALPIHVDRAAFQNQRSAVALHSEMVEHAPCQFAVKLMVRVVVAPSVEAPIPPCDLATADHEGRAGIANPAIAD